MVKIGNALRSEIEKIAVGSKTIEKGVKAVFNRAGMKFPEKLNYHGLEGLNGNNKQFRNNAAYRLAVMQKLFPKGKMLSKSEFTNRFNIAAVENPNMSGGNKLLDEMRKIHNVDPKLYRK
jgi:hypothetical protein